ncbi:MAG TPA: hypothetical protein VD865_15110 [Stenotrophomonas sp.]|nr:hypothetical protein [Stenotrophomonas sp.]
MTDQMFPKPPKRMRQPTKHYLRTCLAETAEENARLRAENERLRQPWWRRFFQRRAA